MHDHKENEKHSLVIVPWWDYWLESRNKQKEKEKENKQFIQPKKKKQIYYFRV